MGQPTFPIRIKANDADLKSKTPEEISEFIINAVKAAYNHKMEHENPDAADDLERYIVLRAVDNLWRDHLYAMDGLREAIGWRQTAQKDPLVEYKKEGYNLFVDLMYNIKSEVLGNLFLFRTKMPQAAPSKLKAELQDIFANQGEGEAAASGGGAPASMQGLTMSGGGDPDAEEGPKMKLPIRRELPKVGRNEPCPCGSGKKFKQCHGRNP